MERISKDAAVAYFKALSRNLPVNSRPQCVQRDMCHVVASTRMLDKRAGTVQA
jgi:hypothetical protein